MQKNTSILGLLYLILITGAVLWFGIVWTRTCKNDFKTQQAKKVDIERLQKENIVLSEENVLLKKENKELKEQLELHNSINFSILTSLVEEYSKLKEDNQKLNKEKDNLIQKQKRVKGIIEEDQSVQMMYFGKRKN